MHFEARSSKLQPPDPGPSPTDWGPPTTCMVPRPVIPIRRLGGGNLSIPHQHSMRRVRVPRVCDQGARAYSLLLLGFASASKLHQYASWRPRRARVGVRESEGVGVGQAKGGLNPFFGWDGLRLFWARVLYGRRAVSAVSSVFFSFFLCCLLSSFFPCASGDWWLNYRVAKIVGEFTRHIP